MQFSALAIMEILYLMVRVAIKVRLAADMGGRTKNGVFGSKSAVERLFKTVADARSGP